MLLESHGRTESRCGFLVFTRTGEELQANPFPVSQSHKFSSHEFPSLINKNYPTLKIKSTNDSFRPPAPALGLLVSFLITDPVPSPCLPHTEKPSMKQNEFRTMWVQGVTGQLACSAKLLIGPRPQHTRPRSGLGFPPVRANRFQ